jgi:hypothetical protein
VSKNGSPIARVGSVARAVGTTIEGRFGRRGLYAAGGGAAVAGVLVLLVVFGGGSPAANPGSSPSPGASGGTAVGPTPVPTEEPIYDLLPTPSTIDVVLLVGSKDSLTATEQQWLGDLRGSLGSVDPLPYAEATLDALRAYLVVFVVDQSPDLDPAVLAQAYDAGMTVHLVGAAASYEAAVQAGVAP